MAVSSFLLSPWTVSLLPMYLVLYYSIPYFTTFDALKSVPGPFISKFSNIWLALWARRGRKFAAVDGAHRKYGKIVRVGFNHISIADERALQTVYGQGNGFLKDHFYEAFVVGLWENSKPHMTYNLQKWVKQLDRVSSCPDVSGFAKMDAMPWFSYLAFDIIGDLAFGSLFDMVDKGRDETEVQLTPNGPISYAPAVDVLNRRGEVSSTLGLLPSIRPFAKYLPDPFFSKGISAVKNLNGISIAALASRIDAAEKDEFEDLKRKDLLAGLIDGKDANGRRMGRNEVTAEALSQLMAGSDTISNTACAVFYWILHGERERPGTILPKLQSELDDAISTDAEVASYDSVKNLRFLKQCIDEGMRLHSTSALSLPRITTSDIEFDAVHFPTGTVLSVPSYTIHHLSEIWGEDVEEFKPERWLSLTSRQKMAFNPFSFGPRACVGQERRHHGASDYSRHRLWEIRVSSSSVRVGISRGVFEVA